MLRAVAALLVLLYHLVNTAAFGWMDPSGSLRQPAALVSAMGFSGVDLFFVISGVVMVLTCYDRFGLPGEARRFLGRRVLRIYPLYWLMTIAVLVLCWVRPELASRDKFSWPMIVKSFALWPQAEYPIVAVGWTLTFEMFFYVVFAGLLILRRQLLLPALAAWAVMTLLMFSAHYDAAQKLMPEGHLTLPLYASPLVLEFIAGCVVGWLIRRGITGGAGAAALVGAVALVAGGGYVGMNFPLEAHYGLVRAGVFGVASALIVYGAIGLEVQGRLRAPRWVVFWGDASYSTYLTHMYVLWLIAAVWPTIGGEGAAASWVAIIVGVAACGAAAALCHVLVERPLIRFAGRMRSPRVASERLTVQTA